MSRQLRFLGRTRSLLKWWAGAGILFAVWFGIMFRVLPMWPRHEFRLPEGIAQNVAPYEVEGVTNDGCVVVGSAIDRNSFPTISVEVNSRYRLEQEVLYEPPPTGIAAFFANRDLRAASPWRPLFEPIPGLRIAQPTYGSRTVLIDARDGSRAFATDSARHAVASPNGKLLAVVTLDNRVQVWDVPPRRPIVLIVILAAVHTGLTMGMWRRLSRM